MVPDRDAFGFVLLLLRLKGELDEELLQFLVTVVDAKLFKAADDRNNETHKTGLRALTDLTSDSKDFKWVRLI